MTKKLPLTGLRVIEFCHVVMGPTCGLVLADLGAEVIKVEPLDGDHTRKLTASGAGFFPTYNRNKKSFRPHEAAYFSRAQLSCAGSF